MMSNQTEVMPLGHRGTMRANVNELMAHRITRLIKERGQSYNEAFNTINSAMSVLISYELDNEDLNTIKNRVKRLLKEV